jgi:hypothetical protein
MIDPKTVNKPLSPEIVKQPKYMKMLQALMKEREMTFEQLASTMHNRTETRHRLDALISGGYINDLRPEAKQGAIARFILTVKGQQIASETVVKDILESLKCLHNLLDRLRKPTEVESLRKWFSETTEAIGWSAIEELDRGISWEDVRDHFHNASTNELLTTILREFYDIYVKVKFPDSMQDRDIFIGFPKFMKGCPVFDVKKLSRQCLEKRGFQAPSPRNRAS